MSTFELLVSTNGRHELTIKANVTTFDDCNRLFGALVNSSLYAFYALLCCRKHLYLILYVNIEFFTYLLLFIKRDAEFIHVASYKTFQ